MKKLLLFVAVLVLTSVFWPREASATPEGVDEICTAYRGTALWGQCVRAVVNGCRETAHPRCLKWEEAWREQTGDVDPPWLVCDRQNYCTVFVTSGAYLPDFGGLAGADAICNGLAADASVPGHFLAWLSDSNDTPNTRFNRAPFPYRLVDGTQIAANYADLVDGSLDAPINLTETNAVVASSVWTSTSPDGNSGAVYDHCADWTAQAGTSQGGSSNLANEGWTELFGGGICDDGEPFRLYCFQQ